MRLSPGQAAAAPAKSLQSRPTLCNPIDGSLPGFSVPGILQARILEWVAISFSRSGWGQWNQAGTVRTTKPLLPHHLGPQKVSSYLWAAGSPTEPGINTSLLPPRPPESLS